MGKKGPQGEPVDSFPEFQKRNYKKVSGKKGWIDQGLPALIKNLVALPAERVVASGKHLHLG